MCIHLSVLATACAISFLFSGAVSRAQSVPLDTTLKPSEVTTKEITDTFRDMVVVQRRAREKGGHFLFYSYGSFDFSDGPTTMYGLNLNAGYAVSDHWEIYVNYVPVFLAQERDIVSRVQGLILADGDHATIAYSRPLSQYGAELLWAPAYGKDSWGPYSIVRSDTFLKIAAGVIQYSNTVGARYGATIGKTFFLGRLLNLRLSAGASFAESVISGQKKFYAAGLIEAGLVWYL